MNIFAFHVMSASLTGQRSVRKDSVWGETKPRAFIGRY